MSAAKNPNTTTTVTTLLSIDYSSLLRKAQSIARAEIRYALAARQNSDKSRMRLSGWTNVDHMISRNHKYIA